MERSSTHALKHSEDPGKHWEKWENLGKYREIFGTLPYSHIETFRRNIWKHEKILGINVDCRERSIVLNHIAMVSSFVIPHVRAGPERYCFTEIFRIKDDN